MNLGEQNYWQPSQGEDGRTTPQAATPAAPAPNQGASLPAPVDTSPVSPQAAPAITPQPTPAPVAPAMSEPVTPPPPPPPPRVDWEASEFIHHPKGVNWFAGYGLFTVVLLAVGIFVLKDMITTAGFAVMLVAILVVSLRPPRTLHYVLDSGGVHVGDKVYAYQHFQSFGVLQEDGIWSVLLMPTARFQPPLSIYFAKEQGEKIVDALSAYLPMENHKLALVDRLSSRLRF